MFPGTVQMKARVIAALIVADPLVVTNVNVRSLGMPGPVTERPVIVLPDLGLCLRLTLFGPGLRLLLYPRRILHRRRPMRWNVPAADFLMLLWRGAAALPSLCRRDRAKHQRSQRKFTHNDKVSRLKDVRGSVGVTIPPGISWFL
jgi:hypothetical protein